MSEKGVPGVDFKATSFVQEVIGPHMLNNYK